MLIPVNDSFLFFSDVSASNMGIGNSTDSNGVDYGFLVRRGAITKILQHGSIGTTLADIYDIGADTIVGTSTFEDAATDSTYTVAFLWIGGGYTQLLPEGGTSSSAEGIGRSGTVFGAFDDADGKNKAFIWNGTDGFSVFESTTAVASQAQAISPTDSVAGVFIDAGDTEHGFLWKGGSEFVEIDIPGATELVFTGVNTSDAVIGTYSDNQGNTHAFLWKNGPPLELRPSSNAISVYANSINAFGDIVGSYETADGELVPYLYRAGKYTILQDALFNPAGRIFRDALTILDDGRILGVGTRANGDDVGFILEEGTPPQPKVTISLGKPNANGSCKVRFTVKGLATNATLSWKGATKGSYSVKLPSSMIATSKKTFTKTVKLKKGTTTFSVRAVGRWDTSAPASKKVKFKK